MKQLGMSIDSPPKPIKQNPTEYYLEKFKKQEEIFHSSKKEKRDAAFKNQKTVEDSHKEVIYNQPNLFIEDTVEFLTDISKLIDHQRNNPVYTNDEEKQEIMVNLLEKNSDLALKM